MLPSAARSAAWPNMWARGMSPAAREAVARTLARLLEAARAAAADRPPPDRRPRHGSASPGRAETAAQPWHRGASPDTDAESEEAAAEAEAAAGAAAADAPRRGPPNRSPPARGEGAERRQSARGGGHLPAPPSGDAHDGVGRAHSTSVQRV